MRNILKILIFASILFSGCESYLDLVPENDVLSTKSIFEKKASALTFLASSHQALGDIGKFRDDPAMLGGDEYMSDIFTRNSFYVPFKVADGLQNSTYPIVGAWGPQSRRNAPSFGDKYKLIRNANTFIENVDQVYDMSDTEKDQYKAEAKAIKAFWYFELIRMYGPIVLVPKNIPVNANIEEMRSSRSHVDTCFKAVVKLLDEAIPHLVSIRNQVNDRVGYMNKQAAYFLKAKVLLYAASPLFNGNPLYSQFTNINGEKLFSSEKDMNKWKIAAEAIDKAIVECENAGLKLYESISNENTQKLNYVRNLQKAIIDESYKSKEIVFAVWHFDDQEQYLSLLPKYSIDSGYGNNKVRGNINPTMRMVNLYYTENGLPMEEDKTWHYTDRYKMGKELNYEYEGIVGINYNTLNLHLKREPRFYANIAFDKGYWKRGNTNECMYAQKGQTFGIEQDRVSSEAMQNLTGYWVKKLLPDFIEHKEDEKVDIEYPFIVMRMADLYLMQAEAWNEIGIEHKEKVYDALNIVRERAGIPTIQNSYSNYAFNPDKINNQSGLRKVIRQERMIELAFEGHRFWDQRRWMTAHVDMNKPLKGWNVFGNSNETYYNGFNGPIIVWSKNSFQYPRDYLWPIRNEELKAAKIVQNPGW